jgi:hypothetical protein
MAKIDDSELYVPPGSAVCDLCRHRWFPFRERRCAAFSDGIPMPIWRAHHDHRTPYPGDRGVRWEPLRREDVETLKTVAGGQRVTPRVSVAETADRTLVASGGTQGEGDIDEQSTRNDPTATPRQHR